MNFSFVFIQVEVISLLFSFLIIEFKFCKESGNIKLYDELLFFIKHLLFSNENAIKYIFKR